MQHSQLCRLIDESLRPFTDQFAFCLTKETEKDLLIVLSQLLRQIQLWTHEFDSDSDNGMVVKVPVCNNKCSVGSHCDDHNCLTKIIGDLILLLLIESQYVQHLAGNILVAISNYIVASGGNWDEFMQSLCVCLELLISNALLHSLVRASTKALVSKHDSSGVIIALKSKLKNANWSSVACIIRVLRNILKRLKQDIDDQLLKVYLNSISYCLASVPWDSMDEVHVGQNGDAVRKFSEDAFRTKAVELESRIVFRGTLVQLFCSLLNQSGWMEAAGGALNKHPVICEISNLIPRLLAWCLCDGDSNNMCMSVYFRHKMLMLMVRLSFQIHLEYSLLVSWLQLMHEYFEDLLMQPMTQLESDQDILEGSPFLVGVSDARIHNMTSRHLQRLAVFLFLRCSFSLVGLRDKTADQCGCANLKSCLKSDSSSDLECYSRKKGLSELYGWLQGHLPAEMFIGCKFYSERCTSFSLSFLRLFIHEDDILFEVLLQLFHMSFGAEQQVCQDRCDDMLFHVSNLFNPIHLFHLFLAELHYDHQVLLDYLISKDTGAKAAEYLLRSLRVVCYSWSVFVEFSAEGKVTNVRDIHKSYGKKRKVLVDDSLIEGHLTSSSMKSKGIPLSLGKQCQKDLMHGSKHCRTTRLPFENAKDCLLSLKKSLQNLHKKSLFPYNPQVLLQRRRWRRKRGTLSLFTRLQSFLRLAGHKVTELDLTFFAYRTKWPDKSPHSWILYGVDGVHGVSPSDDKMILVGLNIVISHLLLWSGSLPQRSAVVCHCSYAGF
ncbi:uncharacterized protein LOC114314830 isoform X1 [Camellia sinensis]|uniref:uncharacterized protein LOC114314830 isoform X1 n=2 Tax=Camellia sinensis TaxID=4442 RepID=UPI0010363AE5|nr:uncharacterized protein LOC114314830 isoform X1 [Camellia sinensis]